MSDYENYKATLANAYKDKMEKVPYLGRLSKLGEEAAELSAAITKYIGIVKNLYPDRRTANEAWDKVIREAADVIGMLHSTELHEDSSEYYIKDKLEREIIFKRERFLDWEHRDPEDNTCDECPIEDCEKDKSCGSIKDAAVDEDLMTRINAKRSGDRTAADSSKKRLNHKHGGRRPGCRIILVKRPTVCGTLFTQFCPGGEENPWGQGLAGDFED